VAGEVKEVEEVDDVEEAEEDPTASRATVMGCGERSLDSPAAGGLGTRILVGCEVNNNAPLPPVFS
jgi:hypothetical protein